MTKINVTAIKLYVSKQPKRVLLSITSRAEEKI